MEPQSNASPNANITTANNSRLSNHWVSLWHENEIAPFSGKPWTNESLTILAFDLMDSNEQDTIQRLQQIQKSIHTQPDDLDHHVLCCALGNNIYWFDPNDMQQARVIGHNSQDIVDGRFPLFSDDRESLTMYCYQSSWRSVFSQEKSLQNVRKQLEHMRKWDAQTDNQPLTDEERLAGVWYLGLYVCSLIGGIQSRLFPSVHVLSFCSSLSIARACTNQLQVVQSEGKKTTHQDYGKSWLRIFDNVIARLHDDRTIRTSNEKLYELAREIRWIWAPSIDDSCLWCRDLKDLKHDMSDSKKTTASVYFRNLQQLASCCENAVYLLPRFLVDLPYQWTYAFLSAMYHCPVWNAYVNGSYYQLHGTTVCKRGVTTPSPISTSTQKRESIQTHSRIYERGEGGHITNHTKITAIPRGVSKKDIPLKETTDETQMITATTSLGEEGLPLPVRDEILATDLAYRYLCVQDGTKLADWNEFTNQLKTSLLSSSSASVPMTEQTNNRNHTISTQQSQQEPYFKYLVLYQHVQKCIQEAYNKLKRYANTSLTNEQMKSLDYVSWVQHQDAVQTILRLQALLWNVYHHGEWGAILNPDLVDYYTRRRSTGGVQRSKTSLLLYVCHDYPEAMQSTFTKQIRDHLLRRMQCIVWRLLRDQLVAEKQGSDYFLRVLHENDHDTTDDKFNNEGLHSTKQTDEKASHLLPHQKQMQKTVQTVSAKMPSTRSLMTGTMIAFWPTWNGAEHVQLADNTRYRIDAMWMLTNPDWYTQAKRQGNHVFSYRERQFIESQRQQLRNWTGQVKSANRLSPTTLSSTKSPTYGGRFLCLPVFPDDMTVMTCTDHLHDFLSIIHNEWYGALSKDALTSIFSPSTLTLMYVRAFVGFWATHKWWDASRLLKVISMLMVTFQQQALPKEKGQVDLCLQGCSKDEQETILDVFSVLHVVGLGMVAALHEHMNTTMQQSRGELFYHIYGKSAKDHPDDYQQWIEQMQKLQKDPPKSSTKSKHPYQTENDEQKEVKQREQEMLEKWNMMERIQTEYMKTFQFLHSATFLQTINPPKFVERHWLRCGQVLETKHNEEEQQQEQKEEDLDEKNLATLRESYGGVYSFVYGLVQWAMLIWIIPTKQLSTDQDPLLYDVLWRVRNESRQSRPDQEAESTETDHDEKTTHIPWVFSQTTPSWSVGSVESYQQHMKTVSNPHLCRVFVEALLGLSFSDF